jgi:dTDP-4-dehydrorhamnose reductase
MKILLFGSSGLLGVELKKANKDIICPTHKECDIGNQQSVFNWINDTKPDIIINAAAATDNRKIIKDPSFAVTANIIGSANIALGANNVHARLVYISTEYVYKGDRGNYKENDEIYPFNLYAWTKLGGECSAVTVKNHLVIRTTFGPPSFAYPQAFTDKWSSKDYVDVLAPMIYEAAISPLTGILNLGTERKTLYDYAKEKNQDVLPVKIANGIHHTPVDTSFNLQKWIDYKAGSIAKQHTKCRCCGSSKLVKYLDLGLMPLANNLESTSQLARAKDRFPLQVLFCEECYLSQLSVVIDPEKMFSYYTYRSGINQGYITHCKNMAIELKDKYNLDENCFHVDIAGNDGTLLKQFKKIIGSKVLNIDPATNLVAIAENEGVESLADFWSVKLAQQVLNSHGHADIITATNVFAHVDNVNEFIAATKLLLKPNGVLVLEFPYLIDLIKSIEFDTIYFEHVSYFSILPLQKLCETLGMKIIDVEKQNIHGGTVRVTITSKDSQLKTNDNVGNFIASEKSLGVDKFEWYANYSDKVNNIISDFSNHLVGLKLSRKKIAAFAASAKGNTLLNSACIGTDIIDYIADETPEKIGKFSPGTGIPIVHKQTLIKNPPDYIVILSWNFAEEIIEKLDKIYNGEYIVPIKLNEKL